VQIYLDDDPGRFSTLATAPLAELVEEVKSAVQRKGRMLVSIQCDGLDVTGTDYPNHLTRRLESYQRIDLHSAEPGTLASDGLDSTAALIDATEQAIPPVVQHLTAGDVAAAMPGLGECTRGWLQVHESICNVAVLIGQNPNDRLPDGSTMVDRLGVAADRLKLLRDAMQDKDYVLVCDVLTYEMPAMFESWRELIAALRR
jgi:hypothetical protein